MPKRISSLAERYHIEDISPVPQGTDIIEKSHLCQQTKVTFFVAQKEGFEVASQPLLRCPKKSSGATRAFPRFFRPLRPPLLASSPSARSQALPTSEPPLRFKSRFTAYKNQKQPPFLTTAFCLGAEGGI